MWSNTPGGLDTRSCGLPSTVNRVTSTLNLHALLSEWEFKEKSIRVPSAETPRKGWEVTEAELAAVEHRLTDDGIPSEQATTTTTNSDGVPAPIKERL